MIESCSAMDLGLLLLKFTYWPMPILAAHFARFTISALDLFRLAFLEGLDQHWVSLWD